MPSLQSLGDLGEVEVHLLAECPRHRHHFVGSLGGPADAQARIALGQQPARNEMEDLIEYLVADGTRAGVLDERQCEPLAQHRQVPHAIQQQRCRSWRARWPRS
jgi:hypothetical protein